MLCFLIKKGPERVEPHMCLLVTLYSRHRPIFLGGENPFKTVNINLRIGPIPNRRNGLHLQNSNEFKQSAHLEICNQRNNITKCLQQCRQVFICFCRGIISFPQIFQISIRKKLCKTFKTHWNWRQACFYYRSWVRSYHFLFNLLWHISTPTDISICFVFRTLPSPRCDLLMFQEQEFKAMANQKCFLLFITDHFDKLR